MPASSLSNRGKPVVLHDNALAIYQAFQFLSGNLLGEAGRPGNGQPIDYPGIAEAKMKRHFGLRRITGACFHPADGLSRCSFDRGAQRCAGSHGVAVTTAFPRCADQGAAKPVSSGRQSVQVDGRCGIVVVDDHIRSAIFVQVGDCDSAAVPDVVAAGGACDVVKFPITEIEEEKLALPAIPRVICDETFAEETSVLVIIEQCDRTAKER